MDNNKFLENNPIELSLLENESEAMRELLKKSNENFVLEIKEEVGVKTEMGQFTNFYIFCPKINFANAYFHIGLMYSKNVLPIWENRFKKRILKKYPS